VTAELVKQTIASVADSLREKIGGPELARASRLYEEMMTSAEFPEFLTLVAYRNID
jgi:hypothetical protein